MRHRRGLTRLAIALAVVAALAVAVRLALDPLATWRTRVILSGLEGMRGTFSDVRVSLHDLSYSIDRLRIEKLSPTGKALPFLEVPSARFGLDWRALLHGHVVARVDLERPKVNLVTAKKKAAKGGEKQAEKTAEQGAEEGKRAGQGLERLAPFRLDRVQVKDGELRWVDAREPEQPELWLHGVEGTLENFATRPALARHEPTVLALRGTMQRTGKVSIFATADPLAKTMTFAGQGKVDGLSLSDLWELVGSKSDVAPKKGVLDVAVRFRAEDGRLSGGVRPVVQGAELEAARPGLAPKLKAWLGDAALKIFADQREGGAAVATTIPIEGTVTGPQIQAVPTIMGILRNAFVEGLSASLHGLPPPKAKEKQGVLEQARRALSPGRGQPRAQPSGKR